MFNFLRKLANNFRSKLLSSATVFSAGRSLFWGGTSSKESMLESYGKSVYVFACVRRISTKVGSINFKLNRIVNSKGDKKEIKIHPIIDLLYKPNSMDSKADLIERLEMNLQLTGEGYIIKIRDEKNRVIGLRNIRPDFVTPLYDEDGMIVAFKVRSPMTGGEEQVPIEEMIPFYFPSPLQTQLGLGPLQAAAMRVDTEEYAGRFQRDFFLNNARPDAVLKTVQQLNKIQIDEIKERWNSKHQGIGKNSKIAILHSGLDYQQTSLTQREMDYIESMRFTRDDILVAFQVPKTIVAVTDDVNRANAQESMTVFLSETIKPEEQRIVERLNEYLVIPDFGEEWELSFEDPTPQDRAAKLDEYDKGYNKWLTVNEIREMEGRPPVDGGWSLYIPFSEMPIGSVQSSNAKHLEIPSETIKKHQREAATTVKENKLDVFRGRPNLKTVLEFKESFIREYRKRFEAELKEITQKTIAEYRRMKKAERKELKPFITDDGIKQKYYDLVNKKIDDNARILEPAMTREADKQMDRFLANLRSDKSIRAGRTKDLSVTEIAGLFDIGTENGILSAWIMPYLEQFLKESGQDQLDMIAPGMEYQFNDAAKRALERRADYFANTVNNTTLTNLTATIGQGIEEGEGIRDLSDRVQAVYKQFDDYRSEMIARTETTAANNEGFKSAYKQTGFVTGKEWIATRDSRTRDTHVALDGQIVGIDETFQNGLQYPGDLGGPAEEVINCRCVLGSAF